MGFQLKYKSMEHGNWGDSFDHYNYMQSETETEDRALSDDGDDVSLGYASSGNGAPGDMDMEPDWMGIGGTRWEVVSDTYEELHLGDHLQVDREVYESVTYWEECEGEIELNTTDGDEMNDATQLEMNVTGVDTSDNSYISPLFEAVARGEWHSECADYDDAAK